MQQLGRAPEAFFARTFFAYSHDDAIRAVAAGLADGAAVDSVVYDFALARAGAGGAGARDPSLAAVRNAAGCCRP
ncbi:MAG: hypothetical protein Kow00120_14770 [Anaerolineae bacterium]